jgi:RND superfamily putative drug exporter
VIWIIALIILIPAVRDEGNALSLQQGLASGSKLESAQASSIIQAQFAKSVANNTLIVVVTAKNVTTPAVQDSIREAVSQIASDKSLEGIQNVTTIYTVLYPVLNGTAAATEAALTQANSTAQLLYGVPALYLDAWSAAYNQTHSISAADAAACSGVSSTLSQENETLYQAYTSHLLASFNKSWSESWTQSGTADLTPIQRASLAANASGATFLTTYEPQGASFGSALMRSYSLETYLGSPAASYDGMTRFAVDYVANASALSTQLVNSTLALGPKPSQAQLESLAGSVAWDPAHYAVGPQLDSLISSFVSPSANTTLISITETQSSTSNMLAIRSIVAGVQAGGATTVSSSSPAAGGDASASFQVTGGDAISHDFSDSTTSDLAIILPVTIALLIVATGLFFRSVLTPFVALSSIGIALGISQVFVVIAGTFIAKVDFTIPTILLTIVIGVGTDYSIFILSRYREERVKGLPAKEALLTSVSWAGESIATSGATVIISFLSLSLTSVVFLRTMGVVVGLGVLVALLIALTLVPSIIAMATESIFWPTAGKRFADHSRGVLTRLQKRSGYFSKSSAFSVKHAKLLMAVALLVSVPALYVYTGTRLNYNLLAGAPRSLPSIAASDHLTSAFGAGKLNPSYVVVTFTQPLWNGTAFDSSEMGLLGNISEYINSNPDIANVTGPTMPYGHQVEYSSVELGADAQSAQTKTAILQDIGKDNKTALITFSFKINPDSTKGIDDAKTVRDYLHTNYGAKPDVVQVLMGGESGSILDTRSVFLSQFDQVVPLVAIAVTLILFVVLDSLILPIFALFSVLMSIVWALALTEIVFRGLYSYDLLYITPLFLFVILIGLGMDYNIFILTRVREESEKRGSVNEAVIRAIESTGGVITAAAIILGGSLGALMLSSDLLLRQIGFAFSFSILVDALFVRTYLVPAVMSSLGRWSWYNPVSITRRSRNLFTGEQT